MNVREKAKLLVALLKDEERLKSERTKAMAAKDRFVRHGVCLASDGKVISYLCFINFICLTKNAHIIV